MIGPVQRPTRSLPFSKLKKQNEFWGWFSHPLLRQIPWRWKRLLFPSLHWFLFTYILVDHLTYLVTIPVSSPWQPPQHSTPLTILFPLPTVSYGFPHPSPNNLDSHPLNAFFSCRIPILSSWGMFKESWK